MSIVLYDMSNNILLTYTALNNIVSTAFSSFSNKTYKINFNNVNVNLPANLFNSYQQLNSIYFDASCNINEIGQSCFNYCNKLVSVQFANGCIINTLKTYCFKDCLLLNNINIPSTVTLIEEGVFQNTSLTSISFNGDNMIFRSYIFYACKNLNSIIVNGLNPILYESCFSVATNYNDNTTPFIYYITNKFNISFMSPNTAKFRDRFSSQNKTSYTTNFSICCIYYVNILFYYSTITGMQTNNIIFYNFYNNFKSIINFTFDPNCYTHGTEILCFIEDIEIYKRIDELRKGDLVKTLLDGYKKIELIGKCNFINNPHNDLKCIYKITNNNYKDLYITGEHMLLVKDFNKDMINMTPYKENFYNMDYKIDNMKCVLACDIGKKIINNDIYNLYHLVLESNDDNRHYGIYANGILSESTSKINFYKYDFEILQ